MAAFLPDHPRRAPLAVLALAAIGLLSGLASSAVPAVSNADIQIKGRNLVTNPGTGRLTMQDVEVTRDPGTLIKAQSAATAIADGYENSRWEFTGKVHAEFDGAVLDADKATAVFANGRIQSLQVNGAPAHFSHPAKDSDQRNLGRADRIDYDAARQEVRFTGNAWYSDGRHEVTTKTVVYNLVDRVTASESDDTEESRVNITLRPDKRVPAPRTPDKDTAQ
jgi:lipopolysaccharide transport protein LptA